MCKDYKLEREICEMNGETLTFGQYIWTDIKDRISPIICRFFGHDWMEDGYAGPDSGWMSMDCRRCGKSHYHTLY